MNAVPPPETPARREIRPLPRGPKALARGAPPTGPAIATPPAGLAPTSSPSHSRRDAQSSPPGAPRSLPTMPSPSQNQMGDNWKPNTVQRTQLFLK
ncbi:hypothetical protein CALCODRAFT_17308 [Calocera cornea HHB12733]|uniref:Uncharacterized protein n=1 Tax=Calocera cornea HHB12733 TaxID=1353952 RepID=A0A165E7T5_9BASI|nr:hypothetical protein CALCODRAFT_17308 [Calocera cornea HHB12733]